MAVWVLELNDSEIRAGTGSRIELRSPGYALLRGEGVELGERAQRQAYLLPRQTYNRFWAHLNQDALQTPTPRYRHNADLAWAHLLHIHEQAGRPDQVIFAVPGHFTRQQLALLLGIVQSCPFRAIGLVDNAVAAVAAVAGPGRYEHIEMYLHHTVLTRIDVDSQVLRRSVQSLDNTGLTSVHDLVADLAADCFIQQCRFDPRHHAETEQALHDQIPRCLEALGTAAEAALEIRFMQARHQARVTRAALRERLGGVYSGIQRALDTDRVPLLGDRIAGLPGFADDLPGQRPLGAESVFESCERHRLVICGSGPELSFVTRLPVIENPVLSVESEADTVDAGPRPSAPAATHILIGHRAFPLRQEVLYLSARGSVSSSAVDGTSCSISQLNGRAVATPMSDLSIYVNGERLSGVRSLAAGDRISFAGTDTVYSLIRVANPDAA